METHLFRLAVQDRPSAKNGSGEVAMKCATKYRDVCRIMSYEHDFLCQAALSFTRPVALLRVALRLDVVLAADHRR